MKQQEINALLQEVISECKAIHIPVSNNISPDIFINKRAKSRFGACRKTRAGFVIELCHPVLETDVNNIKNIMAHELLHTCRGCYNHGIRWKAYAERMNQAYGYNITTTTSYEQMGLEKPEKKIQYKYLVQCRKCGKQIYRQKKSKLITNTNRYRCTCGGKLMVKEL